MFNSDLLLFYSVKCMQYYMWIVILFLKSKKIQKNKKLQNPHLPMLETRIFKIQGSFN